MISAVKHTIEYFRAPAKYFWQWADAGEVIEWQDGTTICYRDDLVFLLRNFYCYKPPSISALLLVLAACNKNFDGCGGKGILSGILQTVESYNHKRPELETMQRLMMHMTKAFQFMDIVAALPDELKKGKARLSLMQQVFSPENFSISSPPLNDIADELNSGRVDQFVFRKIFDITTQSFEQDILYLSNAYDKYKNVNALAFRLRTGLSDIPEPVGITLPAETNVDLMAALAQDLHTAGIARLAQHLIAAMNIPMHVQGSSDMPLGGISDITNRGNYDRLLLSELAHEDDLLMARLVNNEALFLKREEPPEDPKLQRTLLLDTTIKMWGVPRVYAVAVALAISQKRRHHELVESYTLYGDTYELADLYTKEGVVTMLSKLDHALQCGSALKRCINETGNETNNEYFFITDESAMESKSFHSAFSTVKDKINYVITVSREGEMRFYGYTKGISKLLSTARLNLDELLFADTSKNDMQSVNTKVPKFLDSFPAPLYFPVSRINKSNRKTFGYVDQINGVVGINEVQRVLFWGENNKGARELIDYIEKGRYFFGLQEKKLLFIFVNSETNNNKLYKINLFNNGVTVLDNIPTMHVNDVGFFGQAFLVFGQVEIFSIDYNEGNILSTFSYGKRIPLAQDNPRLNIDIQEVNKVPRYIWNNESILFNIDKVYVNEDGELILGKHILRLSSSKHISMVNNLLKKDNLFKKAQEIGNITYHVRNPQIRFNKWRWKDGSEAVTDSRGLLHLRSSDESIPEITIIMILGKSSACWASDGNVCGSDYFIGVPGTNKVATDLFYRKYIQAFIDVLV